jgi:hypothetical protein
VEGLGLFRGGICLDVLGSGDQTLVIGGARMQVNNGTPSPFVGVDVGQLQRALIIGGNHGMRAWMSPYSFACVAASIRLPSLAIRSCRRCQNTSRSATDGGASTEQAWRHARGGPCRQPDAIESGWPAGGFGLAKADKHCGGPLDSQCSIRKPVCHYGPAQ